MQSRSHAQDEHLDSIKLILPNSAVWPWLQNKQPTSSIWCLCFMIFFLNNRVGKLTRRGKRHLCLIQMVFSPVFMTEDQVEGSFAGDLFYLFFFNHRGGNNLDETENWSHFFSPSLYSHSFYGKTRLSYFPWMQSLHFIRRWLVAWFLTDCNLKRIHSGNCPVGYDYSQEEEGEQREQEGTHHMSNGSGNNNNNNSIIIITHPRWREKQLHFELCFDNLMCACTITLSL